MRRTKVPRGYFPPTDAMVDVAAEEAKIQKKDRAPDFVRDVSNILAGGSYLSDDELLAQVRKHITHNPIASDTHNKKRVYRNRTSPYKTFSDRTKCIKAYEDDLMKFNRNVQKLLQRFKDMNVPGNTPMEKAINALSMLQKGKDKNNSSGDENGSGDPNVDEMEALKELQSKSADEIAKDIKERFEAYDNMSEEERQMFEQDEGEESEQAGDKLPPPDSEHPDKGDEPPKKKNPNLRKVEIAKDLHPGLREVLRVSRSLNSLSDLKIARKSDFKPDVSGEDVRNRAMESIDDIMRLRQSAFSLLAKNPSLFHYKTVTMQHTLKERGINVDKKQLIYLLIDSSGSMTSYGRFFQACGVLMNRMKAVISGDAEVYWSFFDYSPGKEYHVATKEDAKATIRRLLNTGSFSGGGTNFDRSIKEVHERMERKLQDNPNLIRPDLLLITDGDCGCSLTPKDIVGTKLHTVIVNGKLRDCLKKLSEHTGGRLFELQDDRLYNIGRELSETLENL